MKKIKIKNLRNKILVGLIVIIAVGLISGCIEEEKPKEKVTPPKEIVDESTKNKTYEIINKYDGVHFFTLDLDGITAIGEPAIPVLVEMLENDSADVRWAAVMGLDALGYKLNLSEKVLPHLKKALEDDDANVRVTAAEFVMAFGDKSGIPVMIDALDSDKMLHPSDLPTPIPNQAVFVLRMYTGQEFSFLEKEEWQDWWNENKDTLEWNQENGKFE